MTKYPYPEIVELPVGRKFGKDDNAVFIAYAPLTGNARLMTSDLAEELRDDPRPKTVVGDGTGLCHAFLTEAGIPCRPAPPHLIMQNAMSVALEAEALAAEGNLVSSQELEPVYLRPAQADLLRK